MARKKTTQTESLPIRSSAQQKEDQSKQIFEAVIKPWMISAYTERDYGIDAWVEITRAIADSADHIVTGKRFSVQLKASSETDFNKDSLSIRVDREKITYWYNSIEPVLLVFVDLNTENCYYRWIDDSLIRELDENNKVWLSAPRVTIRIPAISVITPEERTRLEEYVLHWKRPFKTILTPGNYFKYDNELKKATEQLEIICDRHRIVFLHNELSELKHQANRAIYTIAIVGPSRAGKSTLINCLLHRSISPVGILPTTGIPITIHPSREDQSLISFKNGKTLTGTVDSDFLENYTSQEKNPDNEKQVSMVGVSVANTLLERGIALCDVPGLDDPDPDIQAITKAALFNVNAIIYMIDVSPMANGGFSMSKQIIGDLRELGSRMDRIFLAFNKTDALDEAKRRKLRDYVDSILEKYHVSQYLPHPPVYISANESFSNRISGNISTDGVADLESHIWEYLLSNSKTGLHKLLHNYNCLGELNERLTNLVHARMIDAEKRKEVEEMISQVKIDIRQISQVVVHRKTQIYKTVTGHMHTSFDQALAYLNADLAAVPLEQNLPDDMVVGAWLQDRSLEIMKSSNSMLEEHINALYAEINNWVKKKLAQIEINLTPESLKIAGKEAGIEPYAGQFNNYFLDERLSHPGLFETVIIKVAGTIAFLLELIRNLTSSKQQTRQKKISEWVRKAGRGFKKIIQDQTKTINSHLQEATTKLADKSTDRARVYLAELQSQLTNLNGIITNEEKDRFEKFLNDLRILERNLKSNILYLQSYTDGIVSK